MDKNDWIKKLQKELTNLESFRKILLIKDPTYPFLYPVIENATYAMVNLLTYLENKNPHLIIFREDYFYNRNIAMHYAFIHDLHIGVEEGLMKIINEQSFSVINSSEKKVSEIIENIKIKLGDTSKIDKQLKAIGELAQKHPRFNDNLEAVLKNIKSLNKDYVKAARLYFNGISMLRNNVSHPGKKFTKSEIDRLKQAKLGNAVDSDGNLLMTFEGYHLLIQDVISFFDTLYANL